MKRNIYSLFFLLALHRLYAQLDIQPPELRKALLKDNAIYMLDFLDPGYHLGLISQSKTAYVRTVSLGREHEPILSLLYQPAESPLYGFPIAWDILSDYIYAVSFSEGDSRTRPVFEVYRTAIIENDTFTLGIATKKEYKRVLDSVPKEKQHAYWMNLSINQDKEQNSRILYPLVSLSEDKERRASISFDFDAVKLNELKFYLRDDLHFFIWTFKYPMSFYSKMGWDNWVMNAWYSRASSGEGRKLSDFEGYDTYRGIIKYNSIADSLFFEGNIRVVDQDEKTFVINSDHGGVYHVGEDEVTKVGQIVLNEWDGKIFGQKIFIQDTDNGQIIFLNPVKFFGREELFPKYTILNPEDLQKLLRNHPEALN